MGVAVGRSYWCVVAFLAALDATGTPTGVMVHGALMASVSSPIDVFAVTARDRVLSFASLVRDTTGEEIYPILLAGGTLVIDRCATDGSVSLGGEFGSSLSDGERVPIGRPPPHRHRVVKHVDPHTGIGELFIGGPALAAGYVGMQPQRHMVSPRPGLLPAETRAAAPYPRLYRGDMARPRGRTTTSAMTGPHGERTT
ncbi:hypothetical protein [Streptomyces africanus]|uniref:hypothetical protein n=1 Tax=Streptomyces africanus TaxID=231024 RepID=UPI000A3C0B67|nr:hypothetical protein [Streptomyces africanus]